LKVQIDEEKPALNPWKGTIPWSDWYTTWWQVDDGRGSDLLLIKLKLTLHKNLPSKTLTQCWWEYKLVQPLWTTIWRLLNKVNIDVSYDPAIPKVIYPKEWDSGYSRDTCTSCLLQHY
jgi:hypothetical protein